MTVRVGTSGWQYRDWRHLVYDGRPVHEWLAAYADRFDTVEVNSSFYRLPERTTFRRWADATPAEFRFSVKVSRYLTHLRRLRDPAEPVRRFLGRAGALGDKLGVALVQLPPDLRKDVGRLAGLLAVWPPTVRLAVEFRHESWFDDDTLNLLGEHGVATCLADRDEHPVGPIWHSADWWYLRLHAGAGVPSPGYTDAGLRAWRDRLEEHWGIGQDGFAYFNNDRGACAVRDASTMQSLLGRSAPRG